MYVVDKVYHVKEEAHRLADRAEKIGILHFHPHYVKELDAALKLLSTYNELDQQELKGDLEKLLNLALEDDADMFYAYNICKALQRPAPLMTRIKQGGIRVRGQTDYDLLRAVGEWGSKAELKKYLREYIAEHFKNPHDLRTLNEHIENFPSIARPVEEIRKYTKKYCSNYALRQSSPFTSATSINAACEVAALPYDLHVGVLKAGSMLPILLEILGQRSRYIEWHRRKKKTAPHWKTIGRETVLPARARNILVHENDAVTGSTLRAIIPSLKQLHPENVDICFTGGGFTRKQSMSAVSALHFYRRTFDIEDLPVQNILRHLEKMQRKIRSCTQVKPT